MWGLSAVSAAARAARGARALRTSAALRGSRNLLRKMLRKTKWVAGPRAGMYKPTMLASGMKVDQIKFRKEDTIRCRVLNNLIYKAVTEMMSTCEINQELYDLKLEICKVSMAPRFSACRIYWNPLSTTEKESYVEGVLQKSAPRIRYLLMSQQIVGNVPPIVFIKDKEAAALKKVDELLSIADFGPPEEEESLPLNDSSKPGSSTTESADSLVRSNLFGIDHELLNKQIMEYKRLKVSREPEGLAWMEQQEQQLSVIQRKMRKKKARKPSDDDITPQRYLLDKYEAEDLEESTESVSDYELECELQEELSKLEANDGETESQPTVKLK
uniref:Ribosome binding factor A n=1 Tax=Nothoprocta perdicaria TaxID=30464 RepID=A0A8C6YWQ7_NOTPE